MNEQNIECPRCDGKAVVPMPEKFTRVITAIRDGATTASEIAAATGGSKRNVESWMKRLHKVGHVQRRKVGQTYVYSV